MKECDILGGQNPLWPLLHIFRGGIRTPKPSFSTPMTINILTLNFYQPVDVPTVSTHWRQTRWEKKQMFRILRGSGHRLTNCRCVDLEAYGMLLLFCSRRSRLQQKMPATTVVRQLSRSWLAGIGQSILSSIGYRVHVCPEIRNELEQQQ